MKWAVEIQKTNLVPRNLRDLLASLGFSVLDSGNYPAFTSDEMEKCQGAKDAFELAKRVRAAMSGPAGIDTEFQLGAVLELACDPPKQHHFLEIHPVTHQMTCSACTISVGPPEGLSEGELELWREEKAERNYQATLDQQLARLEPAFRNERAAKLLLLLSEMEQTGETLYKIYELAEGHPDNRRSFHIQFGISADDFNRFQDAVHNPAVTGDWARHAYEDTPKSAQPMSKGEAERFARELAAKRLDAVRRVRMNDGA